MRTLLYCTLAVIALGSMPAAAPALAEDTAFALTIHGHRFQPDTLTVPTGKRIKLTIRNADPTAEEFESHALDIEKVIAGNSSAIIYIGPLEAGRYPFVGEFFEKTAKGVIVAK